jgi:wyosine [tRNA(Phe)-imidazoG37] synthetase (radical SAM superfamily)
MIAFGPVPSRRLGKSLGINNIPAKICSYSCVYCQLGRTIKVKVERRGFHNPKEVFVKVNEKINQAKAREEEIDYLTFVPDGEPTLDANLGKEIDFLRRAKIPIAVITNASLLWREDVRTDLLEADLVSLKVDAISENLWRRVDRPHGALKINQILEAIVDFSKEFKGTIFTETMLIDLINYTDEFEKIANFLAEVRPNKAYVAVPTRPPAEDWVRPARETFVNEAFQVFAKKLEPSRVEWLMGYEGNAFAFTGNVEEDLLSIMSVHPMREEGIKELLRKANSDWLTVKRLLNEGKIIELEYQDHIYYMRKIPSRTDRQMIPKT